MGVSFRKYWVMMFGINWCAPTPNRLAFANKSVTYSPLTGRSFIEFKTRRGIQYFRPPSALIAPGRRR